MSGTMAATGSSERYDERHNATEARYCVHLTVDRRTFLWTALAGFVRLDRTAAQRAVTRPAVSETACPLEVITPVARDGHNGLAVLRKPPGSGPFPVAIWVHPGITTIPLDRLQASARDGATYTRLLARGYVAWPQDHALRCR